MRLPAPRLPAHGRFRLQVQQTQSALHPRAQMNSRQTGTRARRSFISEILGEPVDVHLDPGRDAKVEAFFYHLVQARALTSFCDQAVVGQMSARLANA
jgi:hypothetical protein